MLRQRLIKMPLSFLVGTWVVYAIAYALLKQYKTAEIYAGFLALIVTVGLDLVITLLTFYLWKKVIEREKIIFALYSASFLLAAITDINYNLIVNILGITNYSGILASLFDIPFIGFLISQFLIWFFIFLKTKPIQNKHNFFASYLSIFIIILIVFTIFFLANLTWKVPVFSLLGLYRLLQAVFQVTGFLFALLCLAIAIDKQIRFLSIGYLIIISCSFFAQLSHLTQSMLPASMVEVIWSLGLLSIIFGLINMKRNSFYLESEKWLNSINSVQAQCAFWGFVLCMSSLGIFWGISYCLVGHKLLTILPLQYLPTILIVFSVFAVSISSILARILSSPFERVEGIINLFMEEKSLEGLQKNRITGIYEFEHLENFLKKSFEVLQERNKAQQNLAKCASQVAHDIRSPLTILSIIAKQLSGLQEKERLRIRNAVQRINDIANNLLSQYQTPEEKLAIAEMNSLFNTELISSLLDYLISEKRIQAPKSINFILNMESSARGCFVQLEGGKFKRMISNLINNAIESLLDSRGEIKVILEKEQDLLVIKIVDNGKGIPADILPKIKQGGVSVGKRDGLGLGISGAIQYIQEWNGAYDIQSQEGKGTAFIISLPIAETPKWFQSSINISKEMQIIVLDDDESIHNVWEERFEEFKEKQITLKHCYTSSALEEHCKTSSEEKEIFLIDYELIGNKETGLDVIERLNLKDRAILVTSRDEENRVRAKAIELEVKIIPKSFAPYIPIIYWTRQLS